MKAFDARGIRLEPPEVTPRRLSDACLDDMSVVECLRVATQHYEAQVKRIMSGAWINDHHGMRPVRPEIEGAIELVLRALDDADRLLMRNDDAQGDEP